MAKKIAILMIFFSNAVLSTGVMVVHSADTEVVGQYFFQFGIREVKGDFSAAERQYKIRGVYATGQDFNYGGTFDLSKHKVLESFDWFAAGRFNPATKATNEKLDLFDTKYRKFAGSFTSFKN